MLFASQNLRSAIFAEVSALWTSGVQVWASGVQEGAAPSLPET
ncbi:hypothetical protein SAMN05421878_1054 [Actinobaculum suis]|uniref:Uncharacterized protein n=1 Tax=Actinobaculum suis TaxID=1657 RepID=A0A1G7BJC2_9ACTO|nr:hypothetical protein SAMN05421878_1054 [Actinobaculum suis]